MAAKCNSAELTMWSHAVQIYRVLHSKDSPIKAEFVMKKQWINKWEGTGLANTWDYK